MLLAAGACSRAPSADLPARLAASAANAQERCHRLIHDDTRAFARCLHELLAHHAQPSPERLGIEYFGWVGAVNSARMGMRSAAGTAHEFLEEFRQTQEALRVDDRDLCASVPGDCDARLARMRQMLAEGAPPTADEEDSEAGHRH